ncbi:MAG: ROK family protein [Chthoniobacterales bacterium]|nr:ROK family protein [Chthoniobacterales bacterium]
MRENKIDSGHHTMNLKSSSHQQSLLWGIDLGGTKIEGVIIDQSQPNKALHRLRLPTESAQGAQRVISQLQLLVTQLEQASGSRRACKIGIGAPGVIDPSTGIFRDSNISCLNGRLLQKELSAALECEVLLANDANCFVLAEAFWGAARDHRVVMGLILGTGVGGGIVINGHLIPGLHGIAGEWGNNALCSEGGACYESKKGCNEMVLSGPALEQFYQNITGEKVALSEIVQRAAAGEAAAQQTLERLQEKFAEAIASPINILDPDAIVIGGGVGNIDLLYEESTRSKISRYVFHDDVKTQFLKPILGDSAGVFGAAMLGVEAL